MKLWAFTLRKPWRVLALVIASFALLMWLLPEHALALRFERNTWVGAPWQLWTAPLVHLSAGHLALNLAAVLLVACLGGRLGFFGPPASSSTAACPPERAATCAAVLAWPMSTAALLVWPPSAVQWSAGLSGLIHALWAILVWFGVLAAWRGNARARLISGGLGAGLVAKLAFEAAWAHPVVQTTAWTFPVVQAAHLGGALAGLVSCALVCLGLRMRGFFSPKRWSNSHSQS